jgi:hypothetical protein
MKNGLHIDLWGNKKYYLNDKFHREEGPAWINSIGHKEWYIHGKLHRENGPAIVSPSGFGWFYLDDKSYSEQNYWKELKRRKSLDHILKNYIGNLPK